MIKKSYVESITQISAQIPASMLLTKTERAQLKNEDEQMNALITKMLLQRAD